MSLESKIMFWNGGRKGFLMVHFLRPRQGAPVPWKMAFSTRAWLARTGEITFVFLILASFPAEGQCCCQSAEPGNQRLHGDLVHQKSFQGSWYVLGRLHLFSYQTFHSSTLSKVWVGYGLTAINAWIMSSVFHTMDTPATEKADYFSALATVLASFLAFNLRATIDNSGLTRLAIVAAFVAFFSNHVFHMVTSRFDYGYNMKVCFNSQHPLLYKFSLSKGEYTIWWSQLYILASMVFPAQVISVISHGFERVSHQSGRMVNTFCTGWVQCFWWLSVWLLRSSTSLPSTGWSTRTPFGISPLCPFHFYGVLSPLCPLINNLKMYSLGSVSLLPMRYFMKSKADSKSRKLNDRKLQGFSVSTKTTCCAVAVLAMHARSASFTRNRPNGSLNGTW